MKQLLISLSLIVFMASCSPSPGSPALYKDRQMQLAVAEARDSLDIFFNAWRDRAETHSDFRVIVIMPSSAYKRDYVELSEIRQDMAGFIGMTSAGKEVPFLIADVADWRFKDGERYRGGFTRRVMFDIPDADLSAIRSRYHENPLP